MDRRSGQVDGCGDTTALSNRGRPDARHIQWVAPCRAQEIWGKTESHLGNLKPV